MRVGAGIAAGLAALALTAGHVWAQATQAGRTVYSDGALSADDLDKLFGMTSSRAAVQTGAVTRGIPSRGLSVRLNASEAADGSPDQAGAQAQVQSPAVSVSVPIEFSLGSDAVDPGSRRSLKGLAEFLQRHDGLIMLVIGHTDGRGSAAANQTLSERRAEAVRRALIAEGISETRVAALGQGSRYPLPGESEMSGRQRRVEFVPILGR